MRALLLHSNFSDITINLKLAMNTEMYWFVGLALGLAGFVGMDCSKFCKLVDWANLWVVRNKGMLG